MDHFAGFALEVLHLVVYNSLVQYVNQPALNQSLIQRLSTLLARPNVRGLVDQGVPADVQIKDVLAIGAYHIWNNKDKGWLNSCGNFR